MRSAFIICTRNRPAELVACVRSILHQTCLPDEIILVDASDPAIASHNQAHVAGLEQTTEVPFHYQVSPRRSLPFQRNLGIALASAELLFFIDDDVIVFPDFLATMLSLYMRYAEQGVGGIQGTAVNVAPVSLKYRVFRRVFLPGCNPRRLAQVVHPSGDAYRDSVTAADVMEVEWMSGYCMSFRRDVFDHFQFDTRLDGYAAAEDVDFSYRVSRQYRLLQALTARVIHHESPAGRAGLGQVAAMRTVNRHYLFRKNMPQTLAHRLAYAWATVGHCLFGLGLSLKYRDAAYLAGTLAGLKRILSGTAEM